jgi:hypothetical protein
MVIGQEYSHFSQLTNPLSAGRQVSSFVSMASQPGWRLGIKLPVDLARRVQVKAGPRIDSRTLSEETGTLADRQWLLLLICVSLTLLWNLCQLASLASCAS